MALALKVFLCDVNAGTFQCLDVHYGKGVWAKVVNAISCRTDRKSVAAIPEGGLWLDVKSLFRTM